MFIVPQATNNITTIRQQPAPAVWKWYLCIVLPYNGRLMNEYVKYFFDILLCKSKLLVYIWSTVCNMAPLFQKGRRIAGKGTS